MTGLMKLLKWQSMRGGISTEQATATGNPATFETDLRRDLTGLIVPFTPVQAGSGAPSPSNVRPITGWAGLNVYHSGADTSDPTVYPVSWQTEAGTVYGGEFDLVAGTLTVDLVLNPFVGVTFSSKNETKGWIQVKFEVDYTNPVIVSNSNTISDRFNFAIASGEIGRMAWYNRNLYANAPIAQFSSYDTPGVVEWYDTYKPQIILTYVTPLVQQISVTQIKTLIGTNTIWSDTNGTNTVKYLKKG